MLCCCSGCILPCTHDPDETEKMDPGQTSDLTENKTEINTQI